MPISASEKCRRALNDKFGDTLAQAFEAKFKRKLDVSWNLWSCQLISRPADGKPYSLAQKTWVQTWEAGYYAAMKVVDEEL